MSQSERNVVDTAIDKECRRASHTTFAPTLFVFPNPTEVQMVLHVSGVARRIETQPLGIAAQFVALQMGLVVE